MVVFVEQLIRFMNDLCVAGFGTEQYRVWVILRPAEDCLVPHVLYVHSVHNLANIYLILEPVHNIVTKSNSLHVVW